MKQGDEENREGQSNAPVIDHEGLRQVVHQNQETYESGSSSEERPFQLLSFSDCLHFELPRDYVLVGDSHLTRGDIAVIAGVPGCGKSRLLTGLAVAGATRQPWMNLPVHSHFRTLILQAENGPARLKSELSDIRVPEVNMDDWLRISAPSIYGLSFDQQRFREQAKAAIDVFQPGIVAIDPWNRVSQDDKQRDFRVALDHVLSVLPSKTEERPAVVIVHHLRKGTPGAARRRGRDLLSEISGSHFIASAPRCAFVLEPASPDPEDDIVVFSCVKNNNGEMGSPSAWHRRNGLFEPCGDFDFEAFWGGEKGEPTSRVRLEHLQQVFDEGGKLMRRAEVAKALQKVSGIGRTTAYQALKEAGPFGDVLEDAGSGMIRLALDGDED